MKLLKFLTFVLLFGLFSCRGESPTLPPPPPPQPRYSIRLVPEENVGTLSNGGGRTSFGIQIVPKPTEGISLEFETNNGAVLSWLDDPTERYVPVDYKSFIIFAEVNPGFTIKVKLVKNGLLLSEKMWQFPIREIPQCRWRRNIPQVVFYDYDNQSMTSEHKAAAEWGMSFWTKLLNITWISDPDRSQRPLFVYKGTDGWGSTSCYFAPDPPLEHDICELTISKTEANAAHEIGHGLGLRHSPREEGPYALMVGVNDSEPCVSDLSQTPFYFKFFINPYRLTQ